MPRNCKCCGITNTLGGRHGLCMICMQCDGVHGDKLEHLLIDAVNSGQTDAGTALTRMLVDDAMLTGRIVLVPAGDGSALITIPDPPERWRTVIGRALCAGEEVQLERVVDAVLSKHLDAPDSPGLRERVAAELRTAMHVADPSIVDVVIEVSANPEDPGSLMFDVRARACVVPPAFEADDVDVPHDIMARPRAEA